jgi:hypothetical protein
MCVLRIPTWSLAYSSYACDPPPLLPFKPQAMPSNAQQCKAIQIIAMQSNAHQCKAMQSKAMQSNAKQSNATQCKTKQHKAKQGKAMQSKVNQCAAKQYKAKHYREIKSRAMRCKAMQCNVNVRVSGSHGFKFAQSLLLETCRAGRGKNVMTCRSRGDGETTARVVLQSLLSIQLLRRTPPQDQQPCCMLNTYR